MSTQRWRHSHAVVITLLQLEYGQDEETKHKVAIVAILSMTESEIDETIEIVSASPHNMCCTTPKT